jgi:hypothetical protein
VKGATKWVKLNILKNMSGLKLKAM